MLKISAFPKCYLDQIAGDKLQRPPLGVDHHVHDEVAAGLFADPGVFFMHRIAVENAAIGLRVLQKVRPMPNLHRFERRQAGRVDPVVVGQHDDARLAHG